VLTEIDDAVQSIQSQVSDKDIDLIMAVPPNVGMVKSDRLRYAQQRL
jgi:hypothetical protein